MSALALRVSDERPLCELEDELATLAAHLSAGMSRWLGLVAELDRRFGGTAWGSCAEWIAWRCALSPRSAREHVRVARALAGLPLVQGAFARGELSYAKVRALTRVPRPADEAELLGLAAALTASQLERAVRAYRRVETGEARELQERESLECHWNENGALMIRGCLAPEDGALFLKALEVAKDRLWQAGQQQERGSAEPRRDMQRPTAVEALVAVADAALAHETPRTGADRYQVVVHLDEAALAQGGEGACFLDDGPALAPETARRLACDASLVTLTASADGRRGAGRKSRSIPWFLRRALRARDHGCRFPGCTNTRFVDAHHIEHWADGGETTLANLLLLCRRHHRLVHEGGYTLDRQMRFRDPHGHPIPAVPEQPPGAIARLHDANHDLTITAKTCATGHGDRMNLGATVDWLLRICRTSTDPDNPANTTLVGLRGTHYPAAP
ncbi:MAG TPA: DUF222 domain-containing protein [Gaiellaceae bacterium]|jgi:hypothetical protein